LEEKAKHKITIVGSKEAREGFTFIHKGKAEKCIECEFRKVCIDNLEQNRVYEVVGVRERRIPCTIHDNGAQVVEVREIDVKTAIPPKWAFEGANHTFYPRECKRIECENYDLCFPVGLAPGDKCRIIKILGKRECPIDDSSTLTIVLLRRIVQ